jgi:hypothetical protein
MSYLKMFLDVDWGPSKSPDSYFYCLGSLDRT